MSDQLFEMQFRATDGRLIENNHLVQALKLLLARGGFTMLRLWRVAGVDRPQAQRQTKPDPTGTKAGEARPTGTQPESTC
jgi:hypothetical protein